VSASVCEVSGVTRDEMCCYPGNSSEFKWVQFVANLMSDVFVTCGELEASDVRSLQ
jgi:hypothetical protein